MDPMEKNDLLEILQAVKPGLASKGIIEQFTHFIFSGNAVMTYNDEICVSHPFQTDFQCSVIADDLYKTLTGTRGNQAVKLEMEDDKMLVKTSSRVAKLSTEVERDAEKMIEMLELDKIEEWQRLPREFLKGMFLCMFSASKDMTKGAGTCVYVNDTYLASSDEARISLYTLPSGTGFSTLVPARSVADLINFDITKVCLKKNWIHFKTGKDVTFSARIMEDKYPDVLEYFNVQGAQLALPEELKQLVESVVFMAEGKIDLDKRVEVIIEKNKIKCKAEKSVGEIEDFVDFESEKEFHFYINPFFLSQVLEKATTMTATDDIAYFKSDRFQHIISLPEQ
jgi:hypothetical protein